MIMHVITNFTASAGAETMLARLLRGATDERIVVVSLIGVSERNRRLADNPRVAYVPLGAASLAALPGAILRLARLIRKEQPDVILCWMYHAMVAGTLAAGMARHRAPVFWNVRQSLDDPASLTRSSRVAIAAAKLLSQRPSGIIYNSARALDLHRAYGYANRNAVVIPNGFDLPQLAAPEPRTARRIGIVGRFHPQKDHGTFFKAAAQVVKTHPQAVFSAAGNGLVRDNPAVIELMAQAGLPADAVDLRGEVSDMPEFYQSIDLLVLSSRTEGFPNVIAEAMSFGKPIVTTDVGDAAAVAGKAGIAVPARDPQALADAMRAFLDLPEAEYARYARTARERIENEYAIAAVTTKYSEFLMA
ncbi:glycosyltransferase family 4 protein [Sinorhizobium meliloti]|uniref:glycosyltransferase family 4 protein n=1 Tax=Rhizobium meliloti TaxID=382 RepID=UPI000B49D53D|nr:glycosyltransferase [Sinorhizobium meliloti]ASP95182.1 glycosyl transferase [Sinorhizobium meliloti]ASP99851.1 glycosyl transferase [Sinorhizobium meliloti]MDW9705075.1 glycosyltransferase [Sinorhizobium meliloti]MDW9933633.1 glycosyltransferase [Sinorhizobium meliloti]MDX0101194.1 glycosyltransferase [Sinorhizobium meliloti]